MVSTIGVVEFDVVESGAAVIVASVAGGGGTVELFVTICNVKEKKINEVEKNQKKPQWSV